ncbi:MAG: PP2C family protein-serine/threonine phosphatase [Candidatus Acidiferrales bacterium]
MISQLTVDTLPWSAFCDTEREDARQIQRSLVSTGPLSGPSFEIACRYSPLAEVGGDFFDFFNLPNGSVGIYAGDVVGKGLAAAMYAALVMGTLRGIHKSGEQTADVLALLNRRLRVRPIAGRYCATLYSLFDPATRELSFSMAGLPFPLLVTETGCTPLGDGGFPSGLLDDSLYDQHKVRLSPGDAVLFATDGIYELENHRGKIFNDGPLFDLWQEGRKKSAEESLEHLFEGVRLFLDGAPQQDDIAAVVLKVSG